MKPPLLYAHQVYGAFLSKQFNFILFENLFKPRQLRLAVYMITDFVSLIYNLKNMF